MPGSFFVSLRYEKDRVIELLEEQNRHFKEQIKAADQREQQSQRLICELTSQVKQLTDAVQSLEEALTLKNGKLKKQENISRSLSKLISNESEKQIPDKPQPASETAPSRPSASPKERGNNNSKRKEHFELEEKIIEVNPDHPLFSMSLAKFMGYRDSIRYVYIPPKFIKYIYRQNIYSFNETVFSGCAPAAPFLNSQYDGSFVAGLCQLRYIYSMSVERIVNFFRENGFKLEKPTAHHLLGKTAVLFETSMKHSGKWCLKIPTSVVTKHITKYWFRKRTVKAKGYEKGISGQRRQRP